MAVLPALAWPDLDSSGRLSPRSHPTDQNYDPEYESARRSMPLEIGPRQRTNTDAIAHNNNMITVELIQTMEEDLPGGRHYIQHSMTKRVVEIISEEDDRLTVVVVGNTRVYQVRDVLAQYLGWPPDRALNIRFTHQVGKYWKEHHFNDEVASRVKALTVPNFCRPRKEYKHPIMILGAGFGGIVTAVKLLQRGRKDFVIFEKLHDFGGGSWYHIANRTTKLQTEAGSYHLEYFFDALGFPEDMPTWPSRDYLLMMFSRGARKFGLDAYTRFNTKVSKVTPKSKEPSWSPDCWYGVYHEPADDTGDAELLVAGACICWPGNLCTNKIDEYPGEEEFGGYIEYASLDKPDYTQVVGKHTVIVGHGAFAIENVRTCLEYDASMVTVVCRRRNITAPKMVSWLVTQSPIPIPGPVMMDCLVEAYKLIDWDPWTAYSVTTDAKRSYCRIDQGTMFGVTDVYFIMGYYGLMDVLIGDVKKLTRQCMHLKTGKKVPCEVILKTVGVRGDPQTDKILGLKELVGYWCNGDCLFPVVTNTLFVQASNFAGFSIGPGLAGEVQDLLWFVDWPTDFELIRHMLPKHNKANNTIKGNSLYVYSAAHATATALVLGQVPGLGMAEQIAGAAKSKKQRLAHPVEKFIVEVEAEWAMYVDMCRLHPNSRKDVEPPPFPYTVESMRGYMERAEQWYQRR